MKLTYAYVLSLLMFFTVVAAADDALDERSVRELLHTVATACDDRDIESLAAVLADNIKISITVLTDGKTIAVEMNKEDYLSSIVQSWSVWDDYTHVRTDIDVVLHKDHAVVTSTVQEEGSLGDEVIRQASQDTSTVHRVDGRLLLTQISGRVEL